MGFKAVIGAIAAIVFAACQSTPSESTATLSTAPPSSWTTFLHDPQRSGGDDSQPELRSPQVAWTTAQLDGEIYAEPLVYGHTVYVATETDSVYALAATSGRTLWLRHLGTPVPSGELPCGQIPVVGITSTPVIDPASRRVFAVGLVEPGVYHLYGLDLATGDVKIDRALDLGGLDPKVEGQRGALTLSGGRVLIPFGGRNGDCGDYHGLLISMPTVGGGGATIYRVPSGRAAGLWAPGGATVDRAGQVWVATGNSFATETYDYANSVVRFSADLVLKDYWAPSDWRAMNSADLDMGSASPALVGDSLLFQAGKNGFGYLLDRAHLGGAGGELFSARVCLSAFGSPVYAKPYLYVPCFDGLTALRVDESARSFSVAWRSPNFKAGSPIVLSGAVWVIDVDDGILLAIDPVTGQVRWDKQLGHAVHFATPSAGGGCVFVPSRAHVSAVGGSAGCG